MSKRSCRSRSATLRLAALKEEHSNPLSEVDAPNKLALAPDSQRAVEGADPYNRVNEKTEITDQVRRRSLDDMRRLSEAIKSTAQWTRPQKTTNSTLCRQLSDLRTTLERVLAEIKGIREGASDSASRHVVEVTAQLESTVFHLECAIISLRAAGGLTSTLD